MSAVSKKQLRLNWETQTTDMEALEAQINEELVRRYTPDAEEYFVEVRGYNVFVLRALKEIYEAAGWTVEVVAEANGVCGKGLRLS